MKLVVGLGNPGREYVGTRHNVGAEVLAELAARHGAAGTRARFSGELSEVWIGGEKVLLLFPQTYMNLSGRSVRECVAFYRLPLEDLIVVCDDLNLPLGQVRFRAKGSSGGQKGLQNVIDLLGTEQFARARIGIGRPPGRMDATSFVLSRFRPEEREAIELAVRKAADGVEVWVAEGIQAAMNRFNVRSKEENRKKQVGRTPGDARQSAADAGPDAKGNSDAAAAP